MIFTKFDHYEKLGDTKNDGLGKCNLSNQNKMFLTSTTRLTL